MPPLLNSYRETNEAFEKKLVFHLGSRSGFFSEYNNMMLCMIYCLQHEIQFQLYSRDLSLGFQNGWTDYFEPFCTETTNGLHRFFNSRFPRPTAQFKLRKAFGPLVKKLSGCDYLTYELWEDFRALSTEFQRTEDDGQKSANSQQLTTDNLQLTTSSTQCLTPSAASLRDICRELVKMTWQFKPEIEQEVRAEGAKAGLPNNYLAVHIRAGDKIKEYEGSPLAAYMEKLQSLSDLREVLVMTDDYRIFEQLTTDYPEWNFQTLESPKQQGYQHRKNKRKTAIEKRIGTIGFFAGIELAASADHFVGTFSSNIGKYLGMRMNPKRCHAIDFDQWSML